MGLLSEKAANGKSSVDSYFGPATESAVKSFQLANKMPGTGVVDAATLQAMIPYRTLRVTGRCSNSSDFAAKLRLFPALRMLPPPDLNLHSHYSMRPTLGHDLMLDPVPTAPKKPDDPDVVRQFQAQSQYVAKPWWYNKPPGTTAPGQSLTLVQFSLWATWGTHQEGTHLEVGLGPSMSTNWKFKRDDPRFTFAGNVSLTVADIFSPGSFHLLSPNLQFGSYNNTDDRMRTVSSGFGANIGDQMSVDFIKNVLSLQLTPSIYLSCDFKTGQCSVAPGLSGGLQWVF